MSVRFRDLTCESERVQCVRAGSFLPHRVKLGWRVPCCQPVVARGSEAMSALLRQSITQLMRRPGSTVLLVLLLALGIGVNAGMFALAQHALLRPLPLPEPERLVRLFSSDREKTFISNASYPLLDSIAREVTAFESVGNYIDWGGINLSVDAAPPERALGAFASGAFFETLGLSAARGRLIGPDDDRAVGQHPVVVLTS